LKPHYWIIIGSIMTIVGVLVLSLSFLPLENSFGSSSTFNVKTIKLQTTELKSLQDFGLGVASRSYNGKTYFYSISTQLPDPQYGQHYEAWLVRTKPGLEFFSIGLLVKKNGNFVVEYKKNENFNEFKQVLITQEKDNNSTAPDKRILQGFFD
jgi:hypothetical protein